MEKLFYFIVILTLINFSTQFFDPEINKLEAEWRPTPNSVFEKCVEKVWNKSEHC
jgi:hypothetical protein